MSLLLEQLVATSLLEWLAVILAIGYVWLAAKQNNFCWLCAFLSTSIYTYLFWQVTLPFQSALNFFYMVMAVYGFNQWKKNQSENKPIQSWRWQRHIALVVGLSAVAWALSILASSQFNSEHLLLDAALNVFSVVTTFMVAHKILQNWVYWFFINSASAWLYAETGLVLSACLFVGYVIFSVYGYVQWHKEWKLSYGYTSGAS